MRELTWNQVIEGEKENKANFGTYCKPCKFLN